MDTIRIERLAAKAAALALIPGIIIGLLFGVLGKNPLIAVLAGCCVTVGCALCILLALYARAVSQWAKEHPESAHPAPEEKASPAEASEPDK